MPIRLGTRGSLLALRQAQSVKSELQRHHPNLSIEIKVIKTKGDKILDSPLSKIGGDGIFVKELEEALLRNEIDCAVHSLKDVPTMEPDHLCIGALLKRESWKDVFVSIQYKSLKELSESSRHRDVVGTSSLRREYQIRHFYPGVLTKDIRGNVDTRLRKLETGEYQGLVMSAAGLERLGLTGHIQEYLDFIPAPAQGAIAVQVRNEKNNVMKCIRSLHDPQTETEVTIERLFLKKMGGGCQIPLGAKASVQGQAFFLETFFASLDGQKFLKHNEKGFLNSYEATIDDVVHKILYEI